MNLDIFKGVIVAFYAPYDDKGEVSLEGALKQAQLYKDAGVKGLYLNGSSGEGFFLSNDERKKITEAVCDKFKDDLTLIVHVGAAATRDSIELAKHAEACGAHALSAVPSVYYRLPEISIEAHWTQIVESTNLPFIIYNIPQLTGYDLSINLLKKMAAKPKVIGVKNSSMSAFQIEQFIKAGGEDFIVFNGPDEQYLAGRIMGAQAGIGGTYGAMPELYVRLDRLFNEGRIEEAQKLQILINEFINELLSCNSMYAATKEILRLRGVDIGSVRYPFVPLSDGERDRMKVLHGRIMEAISGN